MISAALLVFLVLVSFGRGAKEKPELSEEIKEIIQHVHSECVGKTGVAEEDISNCENGIFKEDTKLKCYIFCLFEEGGLVDDDGTVDYDMMISLIPEKYTDRVAKMLNACRHLDTLDKDKCQRAFDVHKCSYAADPNEIHGGKQMTVVVTVDGSWKRYIVLRKNDAVPYRGIEYSIMIHILENYVNFKNFENLL